MQDSCLFQQLSVLVTLKYEKIYYNKLTFMSDVFFDFRNIGIRKGTDL